MKNLIPILFFFFSCTSNTQQTDNSALTKENDSLRDALKSQKEKNSTNSTQTSNQVQVNQSQTTWTPPENPYNKLIPELNKMTSVFEFKQKYFTKLSSMSDVIKLKGMGEVEGSKLFYPDGEIIFVNGRVNDVITDGICKNYIPIGVILDSKNPTLRQYVYDKIAGK